MRCPSVVTAAACVSPHDKSTARGAYPHSANDAAGDATRGRPNVALAPSWPSLPSPHIKTSPSPVITPACRAWPHACVTSSPSNADILRGERRE